MVLFGWGEEEGETLFWWGRNSWKGWPGGEVEGVDAAPGIFKIHRGSNTGAIEDRMDFAEVSVEQGPSTGTCAWTKVAPNSRSGDGGASHILGNPKGGTTKVEVECIRVNEEYEKKKCTFAVTDGCKKRLKKEKKSHVYIAPSVTESDLSMQWRKDDGKLQCGAHLEPFMVRGAWSSSGFRDYSTAGMGCTGATDIVDPCTTVNNVQ